MNNNKSNNLLYKIIICVLTLIIIVLAFSLINKKEDTSINETTIEEELISEDMDVDSLKEKLLKQIDDLNKNITILENNIEEYENLDLQDEITTLKNQVTTLKSSINSLESDKDSLADVISNYELTVETLNSIMSKLGEEVDTLSLDNETLTTNISELNKKISSLNSNITTLKNKNASLEEQVETYTVFYSANNKTIYSETVKKGENVKNVPAVPTKGNYNGEWTSNGKNIQSDTVIYAKYYYKLTFKRYSTVDSDEYVTLDNSSYKLYEDSETKEVYIDELDITLGSETLVTATIVANQYYSQGWYIDTTKYIYTDYEITGDTTFELYATYGCVAKGSKISMADGTTKNVEDIKAGDEVLNYDYYTGTINSSKVIALLPDKSIARVFTVTLENGNELKIVDDEYVFDTDSKEFIHININTYEDVIGKNIMVNDNSNISSSKVVSITYEVKEIEHYTMYTEKAVNYIANNIVVLAPVYYTNLRYTFDENYKVDMVKYNADVEKYGTYTYDDLKDVCTKETFDNFVLKDYKYVVEKGYFTFEEFKAGIKVLQEEIDYYNSIN